MENPAVGDSFGNHVAEYIKNAISFFKETISKTKKSGFLTFKFTFRT